MRYFINVIFVTIVFVACLNQNRNQIEAPQDNSDTIIAKKNITEEIAGSAFRKRATGYFQIVNKDSSDFMVVFSEGKDGKVRIGCRYDQLNRKGKLYKTRINEFKRIINSAKSYYDLDSLSSIGVGRLISTGDLAISITNEYINKYGNDFKTIDYKRVTDFLLDSKLTRDINEILRPYSKRVKMIECEKIFFTTKEDLYWASIVETDSTLVPDKLLDCMTWIILETDNK